jgi:hypothetical protein
VSSPDFQQHQVLQIVTILAKYYAGIEMSGIDCFVCQARAGHDTECPIGIAWTIFNEEQRELAKRTVRGWIEKAEGSKLDWPTLLHDKE